MDQLSPGADIATRHVYPASAMVGDYVRAAAGLVPAGLLLATMPISGAEAIVIGAIAVIFAIFGLRTVLRHGTSLEMSETGLCTSGVSRRSLPWAELDRMKLAYYSTRRDRKSGWMQLELAAGGTKLSLDSRIKDFGRVVRRAAEAAACRGIALNEATAANLEALGVKLPDMDLDRRQ